MPSNESKDIFLITYSHQQETLIPSAMGPVQVLLQTKHLQPWQDSVRLLLLVLSLMGSRCGHEVPSFGLATAHWHIYAPLSLPRDEGQQLLPLRQEHISAGQLKPSCVPASTHRCQQPAQGKQCWFISKALQEGGKSWGRKSW